MDEPAHDRGRVALAEQPVALGVRPARRRRVEDDRPAHGGLAAQDDVVAAGGDDGGGQPQLRVGLPHPHDAGGDAARPVVDGESRAVADRLELVQLHLEAIGAGERARRHQRVAAAHVAALDAGKVDGDALPRLGPRDRRVVHLHRADADVPARRLEAQPVSLGDRSGPQRPGHDRPDALQREHAVDVEPRREVGAARRGLGRHRRERPAKVVEPCAGDAAHRDDRRAGDELACLLERELERLPVDGVRLRDGDDAAVDAEQAQDREVLVGLRARALRRVDDQQEQVDPRRPCDHRPHEPLVAGDVDERQRRPTRKLEGRVPEVDRDPARALLRQPVGVLPRQRADERRLAVVDVPGGPDRQRHRQVEMRGPPRAEDGAGDLVDLVRRQRARIQQQAAVADDPDDRRVSQPEHRRETLLDRARGARELGQRERAAADPGDGLLDLPADEPGEPLGPLADGVDGLVEHPEHRDLPPRELGVREERERALQRRKRQLVRPQRALQWMPPQPLDEVGAPDDDARLGAAEELVAREADEVGTGGDARRGGGLVAHVEEGARAEVVDERERGSLRDPH